MKNYVFLGLLIIFVCSCNKGSEELPEYENLLTRSCSEYQGCPSVPTGIGNTESCDESKERNSIWCNVISFGSYELEETSKEYLPQFCNEVESVFKYRNLNGDSILFNTTCKKYLRHWSTFGTKFNCANDERTIGYCVDTESARLTIESDDPSIELLIKLTTIPDVYDTDIGNVGDELTIWNSSTLEFSAIVNKRTLSYDKVTDYEERYDSLELNSTVYYEVISNKPSEWGNPRFKYYYNKAIGLIGFTDNNGITWTIE